MAKRTIPPEAEPAESDEIKVNQAIDELCEVRSLVEAAYMAATDLVREHAEPMQTLLNITSTKLQGAIDKLYAGRPHPPHPREEADV